MSEDIVYQEGSENVFVDIGVRDPEGSRMRADLVREVGNLIRKTRLRQTEVAAILGVDQSKVSKLVRGRISGFTSDRLISFVRALGCDVRIEIRPRSTRKNSLHRRGKIVVAGDQHTYRFNAGTKVVRGRITSDLERRKIERKRRWLAGDLMLEVKTRPKTARPSGNPAR